MQDGREKLIKKDVKVEEKLEGVVKKSTMVELDELEKLRAENTKLMKLLEERAKGNLDGRLVAENEGFCAVTCNMF